MLALKMWNLFSWAFHEPYSPHLGCKHVLTSKQLNTNAHQMKGKFSRYVTFCFCLKMMEKFAEIDSVLIHPLETKTAFLSHS